MTVHRRIGPSLAGLRTKPCRECGEEIRLAARKCIHCGSWQDWRSYLGAGGLTALAALFAFIAAIAALIAALK